MTTRVTIEPGHWLAAAPAASWARMLAAGMPPGGITEAGRTRERQADLYAQFLRGELLATAARPGESLHETGEAIDVKTASPKQAWLVVHGAAHGWTRPLLRARKPEPWHWQYVWLLDRHLLDPLPAPAPLTPTTPEDPVLLLTNTKTSLVSVVLGDGTWALVQTADSAANLRKAGIPSADVDGTTWDRMCPDTRRRHRL